MHILVSKALFQKAFLIKALNFPGGSDGKESACNMGDPGLIPGLGRSPGEGNGNSLQYSCLENSMDRGACRLQSKGSRRIRHNWVTSTFTFQSFPSNVLTLAKKTPWGWKFNLCYNSVTHSIRLETWSSELLVLWQWEISFFWCKLWKLPSPLYRSWLGI